MKFFGRAKATNLPDAPDTSIYWSEQEIMYLAQNLASDRPRLELEVTGVRHNMRFDGGDYKAAVGYARHELESYKTMPMVFDEQPQSEHHLSLLSEINELTGYVSYPKAKVECRFSVGDPADLENGKLGYWFVDSMRGNDSRPGFNVIKANFSVQSDEQRAELLRTLQASMGSRGRSYLSFQLWPVESADEWISKFREQKFSPSVEIKTVSLTGEIGRGVTNHEL